MIKKVSVENGVQAKMEIENLVNEGYSHDNIYLFAHDEERKENLLNELNIAEVGVSEQGVINTMKNLVAKRGDELRNEMESVGLTPFEAEECERLLDEGRLVLVAKQ